MGMQMKYLRSDDDTTALIRKAVVDHMSQKLTNAVVLREPTGYNFVVDRFDDEARIQEVYAEEPLNTILILYDELNSDCAGIPCLERGLGPEEFKSRRQKAEEATYFQPTWKIGNLDVPFTGVITMYWGARDDIKSPFNIKCIDNNIPPLGNSKLKIADLFASRIADDLAWCKYKQWERNNEASLWLM